MKIIKALALVGTLFLMSLPAQAMPVVTTITCFSTRTCATSITGLEVGGATLDVSFIVGAFDTLYPDSTVIPFWNDQTMAATAAQALSDVVRGVGGIGGCSLSPEWCAGNPFMGFAKPGATTVSIFDPSFTSHSIFGPRLAVSNGSGFIWSHFTKSAPLPEPGTQSLLAIGLAEIAWMRRRKNA